MYVHVDTRGMHATFQHVCHALFMTSYSHISACRTVILREDGSTHIRSTAREQLCNHANVAPSAHVHMRSECKYSLPGLISIRLTLGIWVGAV